MKNQQRNDLESLVLSILPEPPQIDFIVSPRGAVFTVEPVSLPGQRYADQFLPRNSDLWIDGKFSIRASDFVDVVGGIQQQGLRVGGAA